MDTCPDLPPTMKAAMRPPSAGATPLDSSLIISHTVPLPGGLTPTSSLPPDHILVRVAYTSLNALDYKFPEIPFLGSRLFGGIPCLDFSGVVVRSSTTTATPTPNPRGVQQPCITSFRPGDLVYGQTGPPNFGACAEYVLVPAQLCMPLPSACPPPPPPTTTTAAAPQTTAAISPQPGAATAISLADASTLGIAALMAYQTLAPHVRPGDRVFVNGGSGGVGSFAVQMARALGAAEVSCSCSTGKVGFCRELIGGGGSGDGDARGGGDVVDYTREDVGEWLRRRAESDGGFDVVVDLVFRDAGLYWASKGFLEPQGRFVTVLGGLSVALVRQLLGIWFWPGWLDGEDGPRRKFYMVGRTPKAEDYDRIARWVADGAVKPSIEKVYDLEDVRAAFAAMKSGRVRGKLVVKVAP